MGSDIYEKIHWSMTTIRVKYGALTASLNAIVRMSNAIVWMPSSWYVKGWYDTLEDAQMALQKEMSGLVCRQRGEYCCWYPTSIHRCGPCCWCGHIGE